MRSMRSALAAAFLVLASWSTEAQPATPAAVRPDVLMSGVTTEVIAILKRDAAAGEPTDVVGLIELLSDKNRQNGSRPNGVGPQTPLAPVLVLRLVRERL